MTRILEENYTDYLDQSVYENTRLVEDKYRGIGDRADCFIDASVRDLGKEHGIIEKDLQRTGLFK